MASGADSLGAPIHNRPLTTTPTPAPSPAMPPLTTGSERKAREVWPGLVKRPGMRLGPVYFVTELRRSKGMDPWAHRKGEPRPFALLWAMYLMAGALLTIFAVRSLTIPSATQFQSGCRAMLEVILIGACGLWPMTRLSQRFPDDPRRSILIDAAVLLVPMQAVIWPMPLLTGWGWDVMAALDLTMIGWIGLVGGLLRLAMRASGDTIARTVWMGIILGISGLGPGLTWAIASTGQPPGAEWLAWTSPWTSLFTLTASESGVRASISGFEWIGAIAPMAVAAALWLPHRSPPLAPGPAPTIYPPVAHGEERRSGASE